MAVNSPLTGNLLQLAIQCLQAGDGIQTERLCRTMLDAQPGHPGAMAILALALSQQGRALDALPLYDRLCVLQPTIAEHWRNLANCMCELGREQDALIPMIEAFRLGADDPGAHFAHARALIAHRQLPAALTAIDLALKTLAFEPEFRLLRARILLALDRWSEANAEIDLIARLPLNAAQRADAGHVLLQTGLYADAERLFQLSLKEAPDLADALIGLALTLERVNRVDDANAIRRRLDIEALPTRVARKVWQLDARLATRAGDHESAARALAQLLTQPEPDPALRASLAFDLAHAEAALGHIDAAISTLKLAHQAKREQIGQSHPALVQQDSLLSVLARPIPDGRVRFEGADGEFDPIFLVGFPRSGTTLLEQLLDAHTALKSFDEQPFLQRLINRLNQDGLSYPDCLSTLSPAQLASLRAAYFADVRQIVPDLGTRRAIDKNPLNLARLPLVASLFPNARVLFALRHPADVVLSCYQQNFRAPALAVCFESLASTAAMYDQVMRYYQGFERELGLPVHRLRYEDLVDDVEGEARRLFDFLQLPWQDELLAFTEHARRKGAISTPSYSQVVQPVNKRAVGKWQAYGRYFDAEVMGPLSPWIERFGYQG